MNILKQQQQKKIVNNDQHWIPLSAQNKEPKHQRQMACMQQHNGTKRNFKCIIFLFLISFFALNFFVYVVPLFILLIRFRPLSFNWVKKYHSFSLSKQQRRLTYENFISTLYSFLSGLSFFAWEYKRILRAWHFDVHYVRAPRLTNTDEGCTNTMKGIV